jgi:Regulated-SNARE-like domain
MPIFYALVARGTIVLTEYTPRSGNFTTVTRVLLGKINPATDTKMSYLYDDYVFHYLVEDGLTYLALADEQQKRRIPFLFLVDIKERFAAAYGVRAKTAIAYAMTEFSRTLADRMVRINVLVQTKGILGDAPFHDQAFMYFPCTCPPASFLCCCLLSRRHFSTITPLLITLARSRTSWPRSRM